ncbi:MAG: hypothetical protein MI974_27450 [Chitinophagales bacterium]|nr:hypothetical protein [Chitinophagales bacterium]
MKFSYLHWICFFLVLPVMYGQAQNLSNKVEKVIVPKEEGVQLDSFSIAFSSLRIKEATTGSLLDTADYYLEDRTVFFRGNALQLDSLHVTYRRLPYNFGYSLQKLDTSEATMLKDGIIGVAYNPYEREEALLDFKGLDYSGNFTRGISFGNNQDLVLNSSFNLQLAGELGDGIEILAAITDENIPLQPEGNTQQLQEFDRIFVQLKKKHTSLIAGDYELKRPNSYFLNYYKKLQGATFNQSHIELGEGMLQANASIAIARGQYTRNQIAAIEGNQGPYRLRGREGERFIIVLAGTEKVFLDGELMSRGLEADYVVDYNRGEITFTNKRLITKDSRIVAEFEYADQAYVRSLIAANTTYERKRLRLDVSLISQQDSKNATGDLQLSDDEKRILSMAGDNTISAVSSGIDTLEEFTPYRVSYKLVETIISCDADSLIEYLLFTTNEDSAQFTARFSYVGEGLGHYVLDESQTANERVYRWVGVDDNCQPLGNHEPVIQLTAPKQQQLMTVGAEYRLKGEGMIKTEVAISQNNLNRFSSLDSKDDTGVAAFFSFDRSIEWGNDSLPWQLDTRLSYELVEKTFTPFNPYRNPEFLRDWNLANVQGVGNVESATEQIGTGELILSKKALGSLSYGFSTFDREALYQGFRHTAGLKSSFPKWEIDIRGSLLTTADEIGSGSFFRPKGSITRIFPKLRDLKIGVYGEQEKNARKTEGVDTLTDVSFYYDRYRLFLELPEKKGIAFGASASQRIDYAPVAADFVKSTTATEGNVNGSWVLQGGSNRLKIAGNLTYRQLQLDLPEIVNQEPGETYLGRGDVNFSLIKGIFQGATTYELGSGQEPKVEFTYVRVNPGEGNYIWLDSLYNKDGIIQPNEMEIAPFQDLADYIRISTVTDEFIRTDNVSLNQSLRINPKAIWYGKKGMKKMLSRFSTISNLSIRRKTRKAEGIDPYNPFQLDVADTALVSVASNVRNVFFFNQADPVYDIQLGMQDNRSKIVQTTGFESRSNLEQYIKGRWNISRKISTFFTLTTGVRGSDSEFFNNKDYEISFFNLSPELTFLPAKTFRTKLKYLYQKDENLPENGGEQALRNEFQLELRYNRSAKRSIQSNFSYIDVGFEGNPNSPVGFAMLNGLQRGRNFLWNISIDQQLAKNIQLRLSYEGRKTGTANVVHTGRAQLAANF